MKKYFEIKEKVGDAVVLFKFDGKYETYCSDAIRLSNLMNLPVEVIDGIETIEFSDNDELRECIVRELTHSAMAIVINDKFLNRKDVI